MIEGRKRATCPWCGFKAVAVYATGRLYKHWLPGKLGAGFQGMSRPCEGSRKMPEEYTP